MISVADLRERYSGAETFTFGDSRELCDELLALVRSGRKTATCGALRAFEQEPMPIVGRRDIALDWDGEPALVIETTSVMCIRFRDVTEGLALSEGEDESLEDWRAGHARYFQRNGGFDAEMWLIFETFRLVEDLAHAA